ncbi:MAG TPA: hypothetical protein VK209_00080, partial [Candidatus Sulfotelmatobacter sp.]|nr:hypothetical protein [Candidatus Sulfotelmatobacter sp.]
MADNNWLRKLTKITNSYGFRRFENKLFFILCLLCVIIAIVPLLSILFEVIVRGVPQLSLQFLTANGLQGGIG